MTDVEYLAIHNEYASIDGVLRQAGSDRSRRVVIETHPRRDSVTNLSAWPMDALPALGVDTFGYNNRYSNSAAGIDVATLWEPLALDVAAAVAELRGRGYEEIILYGTSAGGPLVAFYQAVAEQGNAAFAPAASLSGFAGYLDVAGAERRLPPADGVIMQNATSGPASSFLMRLDGSIVDEDDVIREPELDMYDPANGYDPQIGAASYSQDFLIRYYQAQSRRMNRLIRTAQERLHRIHTDGRPFLDDAFMVIPGVRAYPAHVDLALAHRTRDAWGSTAGPVRTIESDRPLVPRAAAANSMRMPGTTVHTLTSFLSYRAVLSDPLAFDPFAPRAAASGVHDSSSNTSTTENVRGISVPLLITVGTRDIEVHLPVGEMIYDAATVEDKRLVFVDGADHGMNGVLEGAGPDGARQMHLAAVAGWVEEHFPA